MLRLTCIVIIFSFLISQSLFSQSDQLIDEFSFDMTQYNFHESPALQNGAEYYLVVSGTYSYGSSNLVDAAYRIEGTGGD